MHQAEWHFEHALTVAQAILPVHETLASKSQAHRQDCLCHAVRRQDHQNASATRYSDRNKITGSIRTARITAGSAANTAATSIAAHGTANDESDVALT